MRAWALVYHHLIPSLVGDDPICADRCRKVEAKWARASDREMLGGGVCQVFGWCALASCLVSPRGFGAHHSVPWAQEVQARCLNVHDALLERNRHRCQSLLASTGSCSSVSDARAPVCNRTCDGLRAVPLRTWPRRSPLEESLCRTHITTAPGQRSRAQNSSGGLNGIASEQSACVA